MSPCVLCRGCLRLPTNCPSTSRLRWTIHPVLSADWTEHGSATMYVVKDSGACLLVVHVCRTVDRACCGPPTALPCGNRCTVGVLAGTHRRALMPKGGIKAPTLCGCWSVVLSMSRGGPTKVNVIAPFCSCTRFVFDNNSWFTVIGM